MDPDPSTATTVYSSSDQVEREIHCLTCGYNLKSLHADALCPECGTAVELSLRGDRLCDSDSEWVTMLARGAGLLAFGGVILAIGFSYPGIRLVAFLLSAVFGLSTPTMAALAITFPLGNILLAAGAWIYTHAEPRHFGKTDRSVLHLAIRTFTLVSAAGAILESALMFSRLSPSDQLWALRNVLQIVLIAIRLLSISAVMQYSAAIARRIPDPRMVRAAKIIKWGFPLSFILWIGASYARFESPYVSTHLATRFLTKLADLSRIGYGGVIICWLGYIVLLSAVCRSLYRQAGIARSGNIATKAISIVPPAS